MTLIQDIQPSSNTTNLVRITLDCGHVLLVAGRNTLMKVGRSYPCEACARKESVITKITKRPQQRLTRATEILADTSCGHQLEQVASHEVIDPERLDESVGTLVCCYYGHPGASNRVVV